MQQHLLLIRAPYQLRFSKNIFTFLFKKKEKKAEIMLNQLISLLFRLTKLNVNNEYSFS